MSGREWKPGDVAIVAVPKKTLPDFPLHEDGYDWARVCRTSSGWALLSNNDYYWADDYSFFSRGPRPLLVIDPHSDTDVAAVENALEAVGCRVGSKVEAALRSLIAPPKPDEPMGRYAAVVDDNGTEWTRTPSGNWVEQIRGSADTLEEFRLYPWENVNAVRVLSEGVPNA